MLNLTFPEQINAYISKGRPDAYCDDCIAEGLDTERLEQVQLVTATLATTASFNRATGECAICGNVTAITAGV